MNQFKYMMYSLAAAIMSAGESLKNSADNIPANLDTDIDGVIDEGNAELTGTTGTDTPPSHDSSGLPWDARIHSSAKSIKADGTWTKRKGATPPVIAAVEAELRGGGTVAPIGSTVVTPPPVPGVPRLPSLALVPPAAAAPTKYMELCAFLAANTGPGKAADQAWVDSAFAASSTTLAAQAADEAGAAQWLDAFKQALTPAA